MHKREEEFRRADNDRMRRFFNARYDDIPAAISNPSKDSEFFQGASRRPEPIQLAAPSIQRQSSIST